MRLTAGYDIGGAHLKVALVSGRKPILARQLVCPLWRGVEYLDVALAQAIVLTREATAHAVTMTGELADVFPDRYTGVSRILERATVALGSDIAVYTGSGNFAAVDEADSNYMSVASMNFHATAALAAQLCDQGLLIDMGSTTTDVVPFKSGSVQARGVTDAERLRTGELVYTGLTRTPVMAVTTRGVFEGEWQSLARDPFATMADVRRVLGQLPQDADHHGTADGRGISVVESQARLARMFGRDGGDQKKLASWRFAAAHIAEGQLRSIQDGAIQVLSHLGLDAHAPIITAGIGAGVAATIAERMGRSSITFGVLCGADATISEAVTCFAPAVAVALLLDRRDVID